MSLYTKGAYMSGDLDVLAGSNDAFDIASYLAKRLTDEGGDISLIDDADDHGGETVVGGEPDAG